jgi:GH25 family lysozyme M1 (1,4-beta-N-acetylmuramidase)
MAIIEPVVRANVGQIPSRNLVSGLFANVRALAAGAYAPNPNDHRKFGIDLSQYNTVNLQALADYEIPAEYAMIRIGGSATVQDTKFKQYWDAAKAAKIPRSIYIYNWPGWSVEQHIANFISMVNKWCPGDLGEGPIWADVETHPPGLTRRQITNHAHQFMQALESETGKVIGIYSAKWFLDGYMEYQDWMDEPWWWMAQYLNSGEHPGPPLIPSYIQRGKVAIHQTGSKCDSTLFGGTGTFDTDRFELSDAVFQLLFNQVEEPEPNNIAILKAHLDQAQASILSAQNILEEIPNG